MTLTFKGIGMRFAVAFALIAYRYVLRALAALRGRTA